MPLREILFFYSTEWLYQLKIENIQILTKAEFEIFSGIFIEDVAYALWLLYFIKGIQ
jgi:hypothetical protein